MPTILSSEADELSSPTASHKFRRPERHHSSQITSKAAAGQVREARRKLAAQVRNDWEYPRHRQSSRPLKDVMRGLDGVSEANGDSIADDSDLFEGSGEAKGVDSGLSGIEGDRVEGWQERTYASSDPSSGEDQEAETELLSPSSPIKGQRRSASQSSKRSSGSRKSGGKRSFMSGLGLDFAGDVEGESSVVVQEQAEKDEVLRRKKSERKARRKRRLEEEMRWNDGLAFWTRRRDAWCCARRVEQQHGSKEFFIRGSERKRRSTSRSSNASSKGSSQPASPLSNQYQSDHLSPTLSTSIPGTVANQRTPSFVYSLSPPTIPPENRPSNFPQQDRKATLLPRTKPLLPPTDPTRSSIGPRLYPSIYSKVVVQSLTPSVPVNLGQLVSALVDGWKRDGEWPSPSNSNNQDQPQRGQIHEDQHDGESRNCPVEKGIAKTRRFLPRAATRNTKRQDAHNEEVADANYALRHAKSPNSNNLDNSWAFLDPQGPVSGAQHSLYDQQQAVCGERESGSGNQENESPLSLTMGRTMRKVGRALALKVSLSGGSATSEDRDYREKIESPRSTSTNTTAGGANVAAGDGGWSGV